MEPLKPTLLSDLKGKVVTGKAFARKSARPKPVGKRPAMPDMSLIPDEAEPVKKRKKKKDKPAGPAIVFRPGREQDKKSRQPTLERMRNIAMYQVGQRELSTQGLRDILTRRMIRWLSRLEAESAAEHQPIIEANRELVIDELVKQGMIDDRRYAEMKVRGWRSRGWAERRIEMELRKKGIGLEDAQDAVRAVDQDELDIEDVDVLSDEADRQAAERLAQKRRIGPFRRGQMPEDRMEAAKLWKREAGVLARAGFGMDIIQDILSRPPEVDEF